MFFRCRSIVPATIHIWLFNFGRNTALTRSPWSFLNCSPSLDKQSEAS